MSWQVLGDVAPAELVGARLQLHHAAQVVASAGVTLLEPWPDDGHPNFGWVEKLGALVGRALPGCGVRAGLRFARPAWIAVDSGGEVAAELGLHGRTLGDGYAWLADTTAQAGAKLPDGGLRPARYAIPDHPTAHGARFSCTRAERFAELAHWLANGQRALDTLTARTPGASEVRCWPHHFDLGALLAVERGPGGALARSIGIGLSPGDADYAEPYAYVSPWPYPAPSALPALAGGGHWHTEGHTSAVLTASALLAGPPDGQAGRLGAFLDAAVGAGRKLLEA